MRSMASAPQHARHTVSCTDACTEGAGRKSRKSEVGEILRGCTVNFLLIKMGVKRRRGGSVVIFEGLSVRAQEGVWGGWGPNQMKSLRKRRAGFEAKESTLVRCSVPGHVPFSVRPPNGREVEYFKQPFTLVP